MRLQHLHRCVHEEMEYVAAISPAVFQILGAVCDTPGVALRSQVICAAHTSAAFMRSRVLLPASRPPWDLCVGNLAGNLTKLGSGPEPGEPASRKIWRLLRMGYSSQQLVAGLRLAHSAEN